MSMLKKQALNDEGITLVALIITIVVILILTSISIGTGIQSMDSTRLRGFYAQLELVQKRVDDIAATNESYVDSDGNTIYLKETGTELTASQQTFLQELLQKEDIDIPVTEFKYFTTEELESLFDLLNIEHNVFINFDSRIIVSEQGIKANNQYYYIFKGTTYFPTQNDSKNVGTIESLNYQVSEYNGTEYKVTITPSNTIGDVGGTGYVKYKKTTTKYWETSSNTEILVELDVEYNIQYIDSNENSIEEKIKVEFKKDEEGNLIKDDNGNNIIDIVDDEGNSVLEIKDESEEI